MTTMLPAEASEAVSPGHARVMAIIASAMAAGLTLMAGLVVWSHIRSIGKIPTAIQLRSINILTACAMLGAVAAIVVSEVLWRTMLRRAQGPLSARVQSAFIVRFACREGAALPAMAVAYMAAMDGILRAYPAYWANLIPYGLFLGFLAAHRPTAAALTAEAQGVLGR
ncbi:MAG: hypothetical protein HYZ74_03520 [Elusimicrobia bacterium]|nr:hypothetical protein [Elusimicrobiota bacterium]